MVVPSQLRIESCSKRLLRTWLLEVVYRVYLAQFRLPTTYAKVDHGLVRSFNKNALISIGSKYKRRTKSRKDTFSQSKDKATMTLS